MKKHTYFVCVILLCVSGCDDTWNFIDHESLGFELESSSGEGVTYRVEMEEKGPGHYAAALALQLMANGYQPATIWADLPEAFDGERRSQFVDSIKAGAITDEGPYGLRKPSDIYYVNDTHIMQIDVVTQGAVCYPGLIRYNKKPFDLDMDEEVRYVRSKMLEGGYTCNFYEFISGPSKEDSDVEVLERSMVNNLRFGFFKDGSYASVFQLLGGPVTTSGAWSISDDGRRLHLAYDDQDGHHESVLLLKKFTEEELWYIIEDTSDLEIHLMKTQSGQELIDMATSG